MKKTGIFKKREIGILLVLFALIILFSVLSPKFFRIDNFFNISKQIATLGICSVGFTFVLISGGIDLSLGYQISLLNVVCATFMAKLNIPWMLSVLLAIGLGTLIGAINGIIISKSGVAPLIVTLSMMTILNGASYLVSKGLPIFGFPKDFSTLGQGSLFKLIPVPLIFLIVIVIIGAFLLNRTYFGKYVYAIGSNVEAAQLSGINVSSMRILVYSLGGFFTGIGSVITLSRLNSAQSATGAGFEFNVLTACVIGGVSSSGGSGTMAGAVIGVLIVGVLDNGLLLMNVSEYIQLVIKGVVLLTAVIYDTQSRAKSQKV